MFLRFVGVSLFLVANLWAEGLKWDQTTIDLLAVSGDKKAEAIYKFINSSTAPIEIRNTRTSCGCTTAALAKKVYAPGESGELKATFVFGDRKGTQTKIIMVETSESGPTPTLLRLRVEIPDRVALAPKQLSWQVGEQAEFKEVEATAGNAQTVQIQSAKDLKGNFEAKVEEVEKDNRYRILVKPLTTERAVKGAVRLEVTDPGRRSLYLPVEVRGPS